MKKLFLCLLLFRGAHGVFSQSPDALFIEVSGRVEIQEAEGAIWQTAAPGLSVRRDAVISTGFKSSALISLGSSRLVVHPLTMLTLQELVLQDGSEEAILYLRTGRIRAEIDPPIRRPVQFTVRSPVAVASVRGTSFEFDGRHLWVDTGRVLLTGSNGQKVYVAGTQRSYVDEKDQNRVVPPFEAATALLRPVIPELTTIDGATEGREPGLSPRRFSAAFYMGWP